MKRLSEEAECRYVRHLRQFGIAAGQSGRQAVLLRDEDPSVRKCGAVVRKVSGLWN